MATVDIGKLAVVLSANADQFMKELDKTEQRAKSWAGKVDAYLGKKLGVSGGSLIGAGIAGVAAGAGMSAFNFVKDNIGGFLDALTEQQLKINESRKAADMLGLSVQRYAGLQFAAKDRVEEFNTFMGRYQSLLAEAANGSDEARKKFDELGLSWERLDAAPARGILEVADRVKEMGSSPAALMLLRGLGGRGGAAVREMLSGGSAGLRAAFQHADELGLIPTDADAEHAKKIKDRMRELERTKASIARGIGDNDFGTMIKLKVYRDINSAVGVGNRVGELLGFAPGGPGPAERVRGRMLDQIEANRAREDAAAQAADLQKRLETAARGSADALQTENTVLGEGAEKWKMFADAVAKGAKLTDEMRKQIGRTADELENRKAFHAGEALAKSLENPIEAAARQYKELANIQARVGLRPDLEERALGNIGRGLIAAAGLAGVATPAAALNLGSLADYNEEVRLRVAGGGPDMATLLLDSQKALEESNRQLAEENRKLADALQNGQADDLNNLNIAFF